MSLLIIRLDHKIATSELALHLSMLAHLCALVNSVGCVALNWASQVFSGITLTKMIGIAVLALTRSKLLEVCNF